MAPTRLHVAAQNEGPVHVIAAESRVIKDQPEENEDDKESEAPHCRKHVRGAPGVSGPTLFVHRCFRLQTG